MCGPGQLLWRPSDVPEASVLERIAVPADPGRRRPTTPRWRLQYRRAAGGVPRRHRGAGSPVREFPSPAGRERRSPGRLPRPRSARRSSPRQPCSGRHRAQSAGDAIWWGGPGWNGSTTVRCVAPAECVRLAVDHRGRVSGYRRRAARHGPGNHLVTSIDARRPGGRRAAAAARPSTGLAHARRHRRARSPYAAPSPARPSFWTTDTGRIVALASYPTYDPDDLGGRHLVGRLRRRSPVRRRTTRTSHARSQGEFAPASTFKVVSSAGRGRSAGYDVQRPATPARAPTPVVGTPQLPQLRVAGIRPDLPGAARHRGLVRHRLLPSSPTRLWLRRGRRPPAKPGAAGSRSLRMAHAIRASARPTGARPSHRRPDGRIADRAWKRADLGGDQGVLLQQGRRPGYPDVARTTIRTRAAYLDSGSRATTASMATSIAAATRSTSQSGRATPRRHRCSSPWIVRAR